jgi:hypothetical protein
MPRSTTQTIRSNLVITALMTAASLSTICIASSIFAFCNFGGTPRLDIRETDEAFDEVRMSWLFFEADEESSVWDFFCTSSASSRREMARSRTWNRKGCLVGDLL